MDIAPGTAPGYSKSGDRAYLVAGELTTEVNGRKIGRIQAGEVVARRLEAADSDAL